ncbi:hypothetical protein GCM10022600_28680 [Qipengyuania pelagi]|jgi:hypothetical protein|uniref:SH3 domain-containing protein n=1 Tax=Qipengyuania pelagi TaxID=994320 RepID=A0A844YBC6_9SPHN|nr:SH3 domain-containing protein [Qipengyuania pelagi]MXO55171.1 SH3 domain-containing protein [Qipengyuania pelagi]
MKKAVTLLATAALLIPAASPAMAKKGDVELARCETSLGTIAVVDGDTQGWTEFGLGSPRELVNSLAIESGCFTPHSNASGVPADFLMNVIGGSSEEVDQSISIAKTAVTEGLLRSGALTSVASKVPFAGALLGAFGGLGGKKKRVAAGIKLLSPATGQAVAVGSGTVKKSSLSFGGATAWSAGVNAAGYGNSKNGKMMAEAVILAFNEVVGQKAAIAASVRPAAQSASAPANAAASVAVDTVLRAGPSAGADQIRALRSGTRLTPTGQREGLFIEVADDYGTTGWVSVEDLG